MKAAKVGDAIVIDAKTLKLGSRLAFLTVDIMFLSL
jgi:acyl-coenzyme A thioesterase PaaI-like protein